MKTLLVLTICFSAVFGQSLNQQLLRVLAKLRERSISDANPSSTPPSPSPLSSPPSSTLPSPGSGFRGEHPEPASITVEEFKDTLKGWGNVSNRFINHVKELKPMALQTLTRTVSWESVVQKFDETFRHGGKLYEKVLTEALDVGHRLFENPVNDPLAEVKSTEAMVSDLDCFAGELQETISTLSSMCVEGQHFGADKAIGMIGKVIKVLYRFKHDGERFGEGGQIIADKAHEAFKNKMSEDLGKRLLEKYISKL